MATITKQEIAEALGVTVEELTDSLKAGKLRTNERNLRALLADARNKSETVIAECREEIEPLTQALGAKQDEHAAKIVELESLLNRTLGGELVEMPDRDATLAAIV